MTLLTVSEDGTRGGVADVYLQVRPGSGSIFIDSFPLTRLDTQGSTRYANHVACDFLQVDCTRYDFFYTIRAGSQVVGGPSAGAGIAALTVAVLDNQVVSERTAITGTINSGGIIGPVGGVPEKLEGARNANVTKVLVPALTSVNDTNFSGRYYKGVEIVLVGSLEDALLELTGKNYSRVYSKLQEPEAYTRIMRDVALGICERNAILRSHLMERNLTYDDLNNYTKRIATLPEDRAYTLASLCFSSNIELNTLLVTDMSGDERDILAKETTALLEAYDHELSQRQIATITDLEVYAIVKERLLEAARVLIDVNLSAPGDLAYAQERFVSAQSWSAFFAMPGKKVSLDDAYLLQACMQKIAEAEERIGYVRLYSEEFTATSAETLREAYAFRDSEPILCIFQASKAKAQANLITSTLFLSVENVDALLVEKLRAGEHVVAKEREKGFFPLLGYSYTRYAADLAGEQPYSALTFAEYALELSSLDMYFSSENGRAFRATFSPDIRLFLFGVVVGGALVTLLRMGSLRDVRRKRRTQPPREKR